MSVLNKYHKACLEKALKHLEGIIKQGKREKSICGCNQESCKDLSIFISTWIIPDVKNVLDNKKGVF